MVDRNAGATHELNDWFSHHDPFSRAQNYTIDVAVESVLPLSGRTWRVEWREDKRSRQGTLESSQAWEATITISISPPTDDATILINPVGIYVESFDWSQRQ